MEFRLVCDITLIFKGKLTVVYHEEKFLLMAKGIKSTKFDVMP